MFNCAVEGVKTWEDYREADEALAASTRADVALYLDGTFTLEQALAFIVQNTFKAAAIRQAWLDS